MCGSPAVSSTTLGLLLDGSSLPAFLLGGHRVEDLADDQLLELRDEDLRELACVDVAEEVVGA